MYRKKRVIVIGVVMVFLVLYAVSTLGGTGYHGPTGAPGARPEPAPGDQDGDGVNDDLDCDGVYGLVLFFDAYYFSTIDGVISKFESS